MNLHCCRDEASQNGKDFKTPCLYTKHGTVIQKVDLEIQCDLFQAVKIVKSLSSVAKCLAPASSTVITEPDDSTGIV